MQRVQRYRSDLTDAQWEAIKPLFDYQRRRKHELRSVLDAIFYLVKTGCQWRALPEPFPPWQSVYYHFRRWSRSGAIERAHDQIRRLTRRRAGRADAPRAAVIDAQSVRTSTQGGVRGFDAGKRVKGRKRHLVVDTLGLMLGLEVHAADLAESQRAPHVLARVAAKAPPLEVVFGDSGYEPTPPGLIGRVFGWRCEVVRRRDRRNRGRGTRRDGFALEPRRWIVERTFGWLEGYRRPSKDYERLCLTSETMIQLALTRLMLNRIS